MKNKIAFLILLFVLVGGFIFCSTTKKASAVSMSADSAIEMKAYPERNGGAPQSLKLTITNNTDHIIQFGADYSIERLVDGRWVAHDLGDFAVIMIMYTLSPNESGTYNISLFSERIKYPEGDYRIVKMISDGVSDSQGYYAFFKIIEPR